MPTKDDKLGALWQKNKAGKDYFTGELTIDGQVHKVVVFANGFKNEDRQPDWFVYRSRPMGTA